MLHISLYSPSNKFNVFKFGRRRVGGDGTGRDGTVEYDLSATKLPCKLTHRLAMLYGSWPLHRVVADDGSEACVRLPFPYVFVFFCLR